MTDNIRLTPYDKVLAADEIGLVKHLKVKLEYGDDDSVTQVSELNPLPVALNSPITISNSTLTLSIPNPMTVSAGTVPLSVTFTNTDITADPTGTYTVTGTVTASPTGTYTVAGNLSPTGTYTVSGSVTANPTGTYTVSGTVNATPRGVYTVTNTGTQAVSGTVTANPLGTYTVAGSVTANPTGTYTVAGSVTASFSTGSGNVDAFGRLRVSEPYTIFDSVFRYQDNGMWDTATVTGGSTSYNINQSLVNMNVNTASGAQVVRETFRVMPYQPGKSLLILESFTMNSAKTNLQQRVGYFGTKNGVYFEIDDNDINFVLRDNTTGVVSETRATRGSWNYDNLNGSGPSKLNVTDFSKSLILFVDIEWLGVGDVRVGFVLNGTFVLCHVFSHSASSNLTSIVGTYMTTGSLPLRYEITNKGITTSSSTLKQVCSTVMSEGGVKSFSKRYDVDLDSTPKKLVTAGASYPIMSIRLNSSRLDSVVLPGDLNILVESNQSVQYRLFKNATLTGASWVTHYNGNVDYDISATAVSGGDNFIGGYINAAGVANVSNVNDFSFQIGRSLAGVSDVITVVMTGQNPNVNVLADFSWYELF